jgi:predicted nucleic acid-binding Zn ribbon protein
METVTGYSVDPSEESEPVGGERPEPTGQQPATTSRGSDLARAALDAARAAAKARGVAPMSGRTGGKIRTRRRRGWSGAGPDDRDPQRLDRLVSRLSADRGWADRLSGGTVFNRWSTLVGPDVASHAVPVELRDSELTVRADSTAWATQLRLLRRHILGQIASTVGANVVTRLKILAPTAPSWRKGPRRVVGRGPRDTYG